MDTHTYSEIPKKIFIPTSEWKDIVQSSIAKHGVRWISPRYVGDNPEFPKRSSDKRRGSAGENNKTTNEDASSDGADTPRKRKRVVFIKYAWYVFYTCHRSGQYRDQVAEGHQLKGGSSGTPRNLQKASKKAGCKARLKVTCYKDDPNTVEVLHIGDHNHEVGSADSLKHLSLSQARKNEIIERLREGYSKRDCRIAIQKDFRRFTREYLFLPGGSGQVVHRDQMKVNR
ncbi:hypothetical protein G6F56_011882 [Rhizopus delemar]|nr:hypothetical protein G6F56_011882 [Rhizopus delemar]